MSYRKIFWGVLLILLGILFVLKNLNIIDITWSAIWHLWPMLFILWGISVLPVKDYVKLALLLIVIAAAFYIVQSPDYKYNWRQDRFHHPWIEEGEDYEEYSFRDQEFSEPWDSSIEMASLRFDGGAGEFNIEGSTRDLIALQAQGRAIYSMESKKDEGKADVRISMKDYHGSRGKNKMDVSLNPEPTWDIDIDCGAASLKADLREYKVRSLKLDGGAASLNVALGKGYPETKVNIDAGASDLKILVPEDSGCEVKISSVLADKSLNGFEKVGSGLYRSQGFDQAEEKIFIEVDVAVAKFEVERY